MSEPNDKLLLQARANIKAKNNPAHWRDIDAGNWDDYSVRWELERLLKQSQAEGDDE